MRNDVEMAITKAKEIIKVYNPSEVGETEGFLVVYYDEIGIPPIVINKKTGKAKLIEYGNKNEMEIAFKSAKTIETFKKKVDQ